METLIVVADTSVLINFLKLDRTDLIARHPAKFLVTNHVNDEVARHYSSQRARLEAALEVGILQEHPVVGEQEVTLFGKLCRDLGAGESSAMAFALHRGYALAIDDGKAIKIARKLSKALKILKTQDLFLSMIQEGLIDIHEADRLKQELEIKHRFKMPFRSFADAKGGYSVSA
jgi:predicted nucleic acid-binding protein